MLHNEFTYCCAYRNSATPTFPDAVTVVITSCGRWDLLNKTITSFEQFNTYDQIFARIVIDDCDDFAGMKRFNQYINAHLSNNSEIYHSNLNSSNSNHKWKFFSSQYALMSYNNHSLRKPPSQRRLFAAMEEAYLNYVFTEWILQIEDDWQFYRSSFIEKSLTIFKYSLANPHLHAPIFWVNLVQANNEPDPNNPWVFDRFNLTHPIEIKSKNLTYFVGKTPPVSCYVSYSNNPGLRRKSMYFEYFADKSTLSEGEKACFLSEKANVTGAIMKVGFVAHKGIKDSVMGHVWSTV